MVAHNSLSSDTVSGSSQAISVSHTVAAQGSSRVLLVFVFCRGDTNPGTKSSSPQFNGVAPTAQLTPDVEYFRTPYANSLQCFLWLEDKLPANGTPTAYNFTGTTGSDGIESGIIVASATLGNQAIPSIQGRNSVVSDSFDSTVDITTILTSTLVYDCLAAGFWATTTNVTATGGQTEIADIGPSTVERMSLGYEDVASPATESQTWDWTGTAAVYGALAVAIEAVITGVYLEVSNVATGNAGSPVSHTLTDKANKGVLIMLDDESTTQATGVTYNSQPATQIVQATSFVGAGNASSMWLILDDDLPGSAGNYDVSVTGLDSGAGVVVVELNNLEQVLPAAAQLDDADVGAVSSISAIATSPSATDCLAVGCAGHGNDASAFDGAPTGTGTWDRMTTMINPPTSAHFVTGYQSLLAAGSTTYTESSAAAWNRASSCLAIFKPYVPPALVANTFFPHSM